MARVVDPRIGLPLVEVPPDVARKFPLIAESVVFHFELVRKTNGAGKEQQRLLIVTDEAVYSAKPGGAVCRCIAAGLVEELLVDAQNHVALVVPTEWDHLVKCQSALQVVRVLSLLVRYHTNKPLKVTTLPPTEDIASPLALHQPPGFQRQVAVPKSRQQLHTVLDNQERMRQRSNTAARLEAAPAAAAARPGPFVSDTVLHRGFELFRKHDLDRSGFIEAFELDGILTALGYKGEMSEAVADMELRHGSIGFHAFLRWLDKHQELFVTKERGLPPPPGQAPSLLDQAFHYFLLYDGDNSGSIDAEEFEVLTTDLGLHCDAAAVLQTLDRDGSGKLEFAEFVWWILREYDSAFRDRSGPGDDAFDSFSEQLNAVFALFHQCDADGSGYIERAEYTSMLEAGYSLPAWEEVDADGSGRVEFKELFGVVITQGGLPKLRQTPPHAAVPKSGLHGVVVVKLIGCDGLPRVEKKPLFGSAELVIELRVTDPQLRPISVARTAPVPYEASAVFNELYQLPVSGDIGAVHVEVYCESRTVLRQRRQFLCRRDFTAADVLRGAHGSHALENPAKPSRPCGSLQMRLCFQSHALSRGGDSDDDDNESPPP